MDLSMTSLELLLVPTSLLFSPSSLSSPTESSSSTSKEDEEKSGMFLLRGFCINN